ncbi:hypothetical protein GCM10028819_33450 [Spirosoma humi]
MNSHKLTKPGYDRWIKSVRLATGTLILCLVMLSSLRSTASTITALADSSRRVGPQVRLPVQAMDPKPIRLTEAGARQVLKDKADLIMLLDVVKSQDTLLAQQSRAITAQDKTITQLNNRQQAKSDESVKANERAEAYRKKLRAARLENWAVRIAAAAYLAIKFRLIGG